MGLRNSDKISRNRLAVVRLAPMGASWEAKRFPEPIGSRPRAGLF